MGISFAGTGSINKNLIQRVGVFLFTVYSLVVAVNLIYYTEYNRGNTPFHFQSTLLINGMILFLLALSLFKITRLSPLIHVFVLTLSGIMSLLDSPGYYIIHGELMIFFVVLSLRCYGFLKRGGKTFVFVVPVFCVLIKQYTAFSSGVFLLADSISYTVLIFFLYMFFFIILSSEEERNQAEAGQICRQWSREQIYIDIGKTVYSTFIHDYNVSDSIVSAELISEMIQDGRSKKALYLLEGLREMLNRDFLRINLVKDRVMLSTRQEPEEICIQDILREKVDAFQRMNSLSESELAFSDNCKEDIVVRFIPLDFHGIIENLLKNALEACGGRSEIHIKVELSEDGRLLEILIANRGKKIPWALKDGYVPLKEFRPGRTTRENGTGWGVYTAVKRAEANGSQLKYYSDSLWTEVRLIIPIIRKDFGKVKCVMY